LKDFKGGNIPLNGLWPAPPNSKQAKQLASLTALLKNKHSSFVKVAPIRLRLRLLRTRKCPSVGHINAIFQELARLKKRSTRREFGYHFLDHILVEISIRQN